MELINAQKNTGAMADRKSNDCSVCVLIDTLEYKHPKY